MALRTRLEHQRDRHWEQAPWPEIGGQRWVIVGFGSIGHEIAQRARPFGVEIVGIRRTAVHDPAADKMATMDELATELALADVVILACPLTEQTRGLVDADFLAAMRPDAVLVNVARGGVVNDDALLAALDHGTIGSAILDVFDPEPLPAKAVRSGPTRTSRSPAISLALARVSWPAMTSCLSISSMTTSLAARCGWRSCQHKTRSVPVSRQAPGEVR